MHRPEEFSLGGRAENAEPGRNFSMAPSGTASWEEAENGRNRKAAGRGKAGALNLFGRKHFTNTEHYFAFKSRRAGLLLLSTL